MNVHFTAHGWEDFVSWSGDLETQSKILRLIEDIRRTPFTGIGKPEPLKKPLSGWWSRRITREHRLVYRVEGRERDQYVTIAACRDHY